MNETTQSSFEQGSSSTSVGFKAASLFIFIIVGVYSNGRVIHAVLLSDVLRPVLNLFVASLSFADLASCLIVMPFVFVSLVSGEWIFGNIFCTVHSILCTYFANVAFLSVSVMVYERYQAIYRRRFPSLSNRKIAILLCFIWSFPIPFHAAMFRQEFAYAEHFGICYNAATRWNAASIINLVVKPAALIVILFSFWKIFAFLLSLRRRVSPGLLSNEEKLTLAAFVHSAVTSIVFVLTYLIMNAPIVIILVVKRQKRHAAKNATPHELVSAFLWMYWFQCATKPIIYILRSQRCTSCLCQSHCTEALNENTSCCFRRGRSHAYEVREESSENGRSRITSGRLPALPGINDEFLDLWRISVELVPEPSVARSLPERSRTAGESATNDARSFPEQSRTAEESAPAENSIIFCEYLESYSDESSCQDEASEGGNFKASPIPEDVCNDALELEDIERMFDEAIQSQQREWERNSCSSETHSP